MSGVNGLKFLIHMLRFDDVIHIQRLKRNSEDKLYCIGKYSDEFVSYCTKYYSHSMYLTVNEILPNFRGRWSFRIFMLKKLSKYSIKFWVCSDARTYYTSNMEVFIRNQPQCPFYVDNKIPATVQRIVSHIMKTSRIVTCDNLFTSILLAE